MKMNKWFNNAASIAGRTFVLAILGVAAVVFLSVAIQSVQGAATGYQRYRADATFPATVKVGERQQLTLSTSAATSFTLNANTVGIIVSVQADTLINFWGTQNISTSDSLLLKASTGVYRFDSILFGDGTTKYVTLKMVTAGDSRTGTLTVAAHNITEAAYNSTGNIVAGTRNITGTVVTGSHALTGTSYQGSRSITGTLVTGSHGVSGTAVTTGWAAATATDTTTTGTYALTEAQATGTLTTVAAAAATDTITLSEAQATGTLTSVQMAATTEAVTMTNASHVLAVPQHTASYVETDTTASSSYCTILELREW